MATTRRQREDNLATFGIDLNNASFLQTMNDTERQVNLKMTRLYNLLGQFEQIYRQMGTEVEIVNDRVNFAPIIEGAQNMGQAIDRLREHWVQNTQDINYATLSIEKNVVQVQRALGRVAVENITAPVTGTNNGGNTYGSSVHRALSQYAQQSPVYQNMSVNQALDYQTNQMGRIEYLGADRVSRANFVEGLLASTDEANRKFGLSLQEMLKESNDFINRIQINYDNFGNVVRIAVDGILSDNEKLSQVFVRERIEGTNEDTVMATRGQRASIGFDNHEVAQQHQYIDLLNQEANLQNRINAENAKGNTQKANELTIQQNLVRAQMTQLENERQQLGRTSTFAAGGANVPQNIVQARENIATQAAAQNETNNVQRLVTLTNEYNDVWKKLQQSKRNSNTEETRAYGQRLNEIASLINAEKSRSNLTGQSAGVIANLERENRAERDLITARERDNQAKQQAAQNTSALNSYISQYVTLLKEQSQIQSKGDDVLYANSLTLINDKFAQLNANLPQNLQGLISFDAQTQTFSYNLNNVSNGIVLTTENIKSLDTAIQNANNQVKASNNAAQQDKEVAEINKTVEAYKNLQLAKYQLYNLEATQPTSSRTKEQRIIVDGLTTAYQNQLASMNNLNLALSNTEAYKNGVAEANKLAVNSANHYNSSVTKQTTLLSRLTDQLKMVSKNVLNYNVFQMGFNKLRREIRETIQIVKELDSAMLNIQLVTGQTDTEVHNLVGSYVKLAKQLGVTLSSVTEGSVEWLRQGKTLAETNQLLKASTELAKLGAMEASDASEKLTAILNSYKMEVEDVTSVVDKLVKVDLIAATSTQELSTSLQYSASFAANAGVSFDKMIGLIATASETTRLSAETIGQAYKSIFSRMQNIKAGANVDDMGESLNNTEKVLRKYGIELRDTTEEFRNIEEVIDEVGAKWENFTSVQQAQIATAMAGVHQRNTFIATMSNYNKVLEYTTAATNAEGTAEEKYANVLDSIEAKLNELSTTWQTLINNMNMSEGFGTIIEIGTGIIEILDTLINKFNLIGAIAIPAGLILGFKTILNIITTLPIVLNKIGTSFSLIKSNFSSFGVKAIPQMASLKLALTAVNRESVKQVVLSGNLTKSNYRSALSTLGLSNAQITLLRKQKVLDFSTGKLVISNKALAASEATSTAATSALNIALGAVAAVIGIAVMAYSAFSQAQEEARQKALNSLNTQVDETKALEKLIEKYKELKTIISTGTQNLTEEELYNTKKEILEIQDEVNEKYNAEKNQIDLLNGSLKKNIALLRMQQAENNKKTVDETRSQYNDATAWLNRSYYKDMIFMPEIDGAKHKTDILKELDIGKISQQYGVGGESLGYIVGIEGNIKEQIDFLYESIGKLDDYISNTSDKTLKDAAGQLRNSFSSTLAELKSDKFKEQITLEEIFEKSFIGSDTKLMDFTDALSNAQQEYSEALLSGDKKVIAGKKALYEMSVKELSEYGQETLVESDYSIIEKYIEDINNLIDENYVKINELFANGIFTKEMFDGLTDVDIKGAFVSIGAGSENVDEKFIIMKNTAEELGLEVESLINTLIALGLVENKFNPIEDEIFDFDYTAAIASVNTLSDSYKKLLDAMKKIRTGKFTYDDALGLMTDFPDLGEYLDENDKNFSGFMKGIRQEIEELSEDVYSSFSKSSEQIEKELGITIETFKTKSEKDINDFAYAEGTSVDTYFQKTKSGENLAITINPVLPDGTILSGDALTEYLNSITSFKQARYDPLVLSVQTISTDEPTDEQRVAFDNLDEEINNLLITYNNLEDEEQKVAIAMRLADLAVEKNKNNIETISEGYEDLKTRTSEVTTAYKDLYKEGYVQGDAMFELLNKYPELMKYYDEEAGRLVMKKEVLKDIYEIEKKTKLQEIQDEIDRIKKLRTQDILSSDYNKNMSKELLDMVHEQGSISDEIYSKSLNDLKEFGSVQSKTVLEVISGISNIGTEAVIQMISARIVSGSISAEMGSKMINEVLSDMTKYDSQISDLETEYKLLDNYNPWYDIENDTKEASDALSNYKSYLSEIINMYDRIGNAIESAVDLEIEALDKEKDALEKSNDEQERKLALLEKEEALNRAKTQRTVRVYNAETGKFEWETNSQEIKEAQKEYDEEVKKQRVETEKERIDTEKEAWQNFKKQITDIPDDVKDAENLEFAKKYFGVKNASDLLNISDEKLKEFKKEYSSVVHLSNSIGYGESYKTINDGEENGGIMTASQLTEYFGTDFSTIGTGLYNIVSDAFKNVLENVNAMSNKSNTSAQVVQTTTNGDTISIGEVVVNSPKNLTDLLNEIKKQSSTKSVK